MSWGALRSSSQLRRYFTRKRSEVQVLYRPPLSQEILIDCLFLRQVNTESGFRLYLCS